jgi:hypothetical protein
VANPLIEDQTASCHAPPGTDCAVALPLPLLLRTPEYDRFEYGGLPVAVWMTVITL